MKRDLGKFGGRKRQLRFTLEEFDGGRGVRRGLDIREYFLPDDADDPDDYKPKKKGIWLNDGRVAKLREILDDRRDEIDSWLKGGALPSKPKWVNQREADEQTISQFIPDLDSTSTETNRDYFFEVEHRGGRATVQYNTKHAFQAALAAISIGELLARSNLFDAIFAAFDDACRAVDQGEETIPSDLQLTQLKAYWSMYLAHYLAKTTEDTGKTDPEGPPSQ